MNTRELERLLRPALANTRARFLGVFAADRAPAWASLRPDDCYVLNTDRAAEDGEHWLAVYQPRAAPAELFDSFALPPSAYTDAGPLLASRPANLRLTPRPLQHPMSTVCGHYCVYYLYHRARGLSLTRIVARLEDLSPVATVRDKHVRHFSQNLARRHGLRPVRGHGLSAAVASSLLPCAPNQNCCSLHLASRIRS